MSGAEYASQEVEMQRMLSVMMLVLAAVVGVPGVAHAAHYVIPPNTVTEIDIEVCRTEQEPGWFNLPGYMVVSGPGETVEWTCDRSYLQIAYGPAYQVDAQWRRQVGMYYGTAPTFDDLGTCVLSDGGPIDGNDTGAIVDSNDDYGTCG